MLNPAHTRAAFLDELEKIGKTRSVKEYRAAVQSDPAHAANVARASGELGLAPRHVGDISMGGAEAGVDKMIGHVQGPTGEINASGVLARKLYKPDSSISRQEFTGPLLEQKQQVTDAARALSPEAKAMVPAMYGHKEMNFLNGQSRHQSFHEYLPNIDDLRGKNIGSEDKPIYSRGSHYRGDLDKVESTVLNPMKAKGMTMADTISSGEGGRGVNWGNVVHSPEGPKVLDFLPNVEGKSNPAIDSYRKYRPGDSEFEGGKGTLQGLRKEVFNPSMKIVPPVDAPAAMPPIPKSSVRSVAPTLNAVEHAAATGAASPMGRAAKGLGNIISGSQVQSVPPGLLTRFKDVAKGLMGHLHR